MDKTKIAAIIMAGGKGVRMNSDTPKVLHEIGGEPMIFHFINTLKQIGVTDIQVVVSYKSEEVKQKIIPKHQVKFALQSQPLGTADAVKAGLTTISDDAQTILIAGGDDSAFYLPETLKSFINSHLSSKAKVSMLTVLDPLKQRVGKVFRDSEGNFDKILEYSEYSQLNLDTDEINCGMYLFEYSWLKENLEKVAKNPVKNEYYLTDLLNIAKSQNDLVNLFILQNKDEWFGVNDQAELEMANKLWQATTGLHNRDRLNMMNDQSFILSEKKRVHFLGIGGAGASPVAAIAQAAGFEITGCDQNLEGSNIQNFKPSQLQSGHSKDHLENVDILAYSPALESFDPNNEELVSARAQGIETLTWQNFLGKYLLKDKLVIAVCGAHGKSTTTAMVGKMLEDCGVDPTVELGATFLSGGTNFRIGKSKYFVIEADEYNNNFLNYHPDIAVVLNIDLEHLEFFKDLDQIKDSYQQFLSQTKKLVIANLENPNVAEVIKYVMKGKNPPQVIDYNKLEIQMNLKVFGLHNYQNAKAAFQVGLSLGLEPKDIISSLNNFPGIGRRFEKIGERAGCQIFSDFSHHPSEIEAALNAAKQHFPDKKIHLVFQPHLFTRTKKLFELFVKVFKNSDIDEVKILDIYPSREKDPGDISSQMLVEAVDKPQTEYAPDLYSLWNLIKDKLTEDDILIFMGAGDIDSKIREILDQ